MLKARYAQKEDYEKFNNFYKTGDKTMPENWRADFNDYDTFVTEKKIILLFNEEEVVGYAIWFPFEDAHYAEISDIFVDSEWTELGYIDLYRMIIDETKKKDIPKIETISDNMITDRILSRCGFKSVNSSDQYVYEFMK